MASKKKPGRPKGERTKKIFEFDEVQVLSDGVQWIIVDEKGTRYYMTSLEKTFKRIIDHHIMNSPEVIENVQDLRALMKRAGERCKELAAEVSR